MYRDDGDSFIADSGVLCCQCCLPSDPYWHDSGGKPVALLESAFLRAFADHFIDLMNEKAGFNSKVVLVQPRGGHPEAADRFAEQDGLYTLILRGRENGQPVERKRVISAASRCLDPKRDWEKLLDCARNPVLRFVISNTTEAGIAFDPACKADDAPPSAFPAKIRIVARIFFSCFNRFCTKSICWGPPRARFVGKT